MERPGDVRAAIWLWQVLKRACYGLLAEEKKVNTIDVPVRLIIETDGIEEFADIIKSDGTLRVVVCPGCYSLVPFKRLAEHREKLGH